MDTLPKMTFGGEETTWKSLPKNHIWDAVRDGKLHEVGQGWEIRQEEFIGENCGGLGDISGKKCNYKLYNYRRISLFQRAILLVWETKKNLITGIAIHWKREAQICNIFLYHSSKIDLLIR